MLHATYSSSHKKSAPVFVNESWVSPFVLPFVGFIRGQNEWLLARLTTHWLTSCLRFDCVNCCNHPAVDLSGLIAIILAALRSITLVAAVAGLGPTHRHDAAVRFSNAAQSRGVGECGQCGKNHMLVVACNRQWLFIKIALKNAAYVSDCAPLLLRFYEGCWLQQRVPRIGCHMPLECAGSNSACIKSKSKITTQMRAISIFSFIYTYERIKLHMLI